MTYCLGIKLKSGIIGISDTRITSGNETTQAKKVFTVNREKHSFFIMTSGLRSVRDKAITYFKEALDEGKEASPNKIYKAVNAFASQIKRVAIEDKEGLKQAGLTFNLNAIIGGQLEDDDEHKVYLLYPEGNWVEVTESSPFVIIGNNGYGKPILDRVLKYNSSFTFAIKAAFLSYEATRISSNDVDYPIDFVYYRKDSFDVIEKRYIQDELAAVSKFWNKKLSDSIGQLPESWIEKILHTLP